MNRLDKILKKADYLGMVVILVYFYQGQDQNIADEIGIINAVNNATNWVLGKEYRNVMIEINNECSVSSYDHAILKPNRVNEPIIRVKDKQKKGYRLLVSTSYSGNAVPSSNVVEVSYFLLMHGNGVNNPDRITQMVEETRNVKGYKTFPILFKEDDHYDFEKPMNNLLSAIKTHASWGFFDHRRNSEPYTEGFQSVPVDWSINSD